jgi:hypothetical protein
MFSAGEEGKKGTDVVRQLILNPAIVSADRKCTAMFSAGEEL